MRYYEKGKLLIENRRNCAEFESLRAFKHLDEISGEIVRNFSDISKDEKIGKRERESKIDDMKRGTFSKYLLAR